MEAALSFIGIDSFLRDPKGLTCITLHSFTDFFEVFTSDTVTDGPCRCPGFRKPVHEREPEKVVPGKIAIRRFWGYGRWPVRVSQQPKHRAQGPAVNGVITKKRA